MIAMTTSNSIRVKPSPDFDSVQKGFFTMRVSMYLLPHATLRQSLNNLRCRRTRCPEQFDRCGRRGPQSAPCDLPGAPYLLKGRRDYAHYWHEPAGQPHAQGRDARRRDLRRID